MKNVKKNVVEDMDGNDVFLIDGLSKDDWSLTLNELRGQLVQLKLQLSVVKGGIDRISLELRKYD